jgi:predicted O-linked N-acetylglucosamine transferase (SPINDLY family)
MTDRQAYATVKGDQLDLLVDLSGYSAGHRLSLLARKPAPRIATGLGFITPIGSPMIDYALLDPWMLPADLAHLIPEKSAGIKTNLYFSPGEEMPLESQEREHIVFGSGNALYKMTAPVVKLWSEVLKRVPGSVLSLKSKTLTDPGVQLLVAARFAEHGIGQDRLRFTGTTTRREHMQWYSSVDICLDPFPYQGGYTTLESLYMGCPVISLNAGGISTTIGALSLCGLDTYIANSPNEYVALACSLGMMLQSLSAESRMKIREHVRQSLQASVIMDGKAFTEDIEAAYRRICA